jgi:hypothetical protein
VQVDIGEFFGICRENFTPINILEKKWEFEHLCTFASNIIQQWIPELYSVVDLKKKCKIL